MMVTKRKPLRRAVVAVEFAFILPFILILVMGIIEVGRLIEVQQVLTNAAREGARQAATGQLTNAQVKLVINQYMQEAGFNTTGMADAVVDVTSGNDVSQANYLDRITITVTYPYANAAFSPLSYILPSGYMVTSKVQWITMVDQPFPSFPNPPVG